nr:4-(cytidine 5'-diphospho)-2-C-methyl-D-erythritol kinase [Schlegelella koreensis]
MRSIIDVAAPAKLNLFLHVVGRRTDGYHLLQSVMVLIDWADVLHVERRDDGRLARHDLGPALPADDLCLRAARALRAASGTSLGADISIEKRVPWGAGMGGGSSDAASTLLALNRLWGLGWPLEKLLPLGLALGADVPFFLRGRNAAVEGIGERITPIEAAPRTFAVVKPADGIETRAVFTSPLVGRSQEAAIVEGFTARQFDDSGREYGRNDLQRAAEALSSDVAAVSSWLEERYGNSRMTGSGSAVFARTSLESTGLPDELPAGWTGRICRSLAAHPLLGWADEPA